VVDACSDTVAVWAMGVPPVWSTSETVTVYFPGLPYVRVAVNGRSMRPVVASVYGVP
jgi:hypothetical protein